MIVTVAIIQVAFLFFYVEIIYKYDIWFLLIIIIIYIL